MLRIESLAKEYLHKVMGSDAPQKNMRLLEGKAIFLTGSELALHHGAMGLFTGVIEDTFNIPRQPFNMKVAEAAISANTSLVFSGWTHDKNQRLHIKYFDSPAEVIRFQRVVSQCHLMITDRPNTAQMENMDRIGLALPDKIYRSLKKFGEGRFDKAQFPQR